MLQLNRTSVIAIGLAVMACFLVSRLLRNSLTPEDEPPDRVVLVESGTGSSPLEVKHRNESRTRMHQKSAQSSSQNLTSGVRTIAMQTPSPLPPLTGYVLDHFDDWTSIPETYETDGIFIRNGAITLSDVDGSSEPRTGILVSPPFPLKLPAMAAPVKDGRTLPPGSDVILEIALSEDGKTWSPWAVADRYHPPDGKRVAPPVQSVLSTVEIAARDTGSQADYNRISGPSLRYRLTLSATGQQAPSISDVRIWKREY